MRIEWTSEACEPEETFLAQARHACSLGLPFVTKGSRGSLAVAGGGPSLTDHVEALKGFDEVWGINRTAQWLCERGVEATFFTVDPQYMPGMTGVERALLASSCHPKLFEELAGKDVTLFHITPHGDEFVCEGGPTSACRAIPLAVHMGFSSITFFGCEGSFGDASHAYPTDIQRCQTIVLAGGKEYVSTPEFELQSGYLASFVRDLPEFFREESGGLLRAMIEHPDWEHVALSGDIMARVLPEGTTLADLPEYERAA
jgi:hypothetical protein